MCNVLWRVSRHQTTAALTTARMTRAATKPAISPVDTEFCFAGGGSRARVAVVVKESEPPNVAVLGGCPVPPKICDRNTTVRPTSALACGPSERSTPADRLKGADAPNGSDASNLPERSNAHDFQNSSVGSNPAVPANSLEQRIGPDRRSVADRLIAGDGPGGRDRLNAVDGLRAEEATNGADPRNGADSLNGADGLSAEEGTNVADESTEADRLTGGDLLKSADAWASPDCSWDPDRPNVEGRSCDAPRRADRQVDPVARSCRVRSKIRVVKTGGDPNATETPSSGEPLNANVAGNRLGSAKSDALGGTREAGRAEDRRCPDSRKADDVTNCVVADTIGDGDLDPDALWHGDFVLEAVGDGVFTGEADADGMPGQSNVFIAKIQNDAVAVVQQLERIVMPVVATGDKK